MTTTGIERIARRARNQPPPPYTSLRPHDTVENLRVGGCGAGGNESAWSGWRDQDSLGAEPRGAPPRTAPETVPTVVPTATGAPGGDSPGRWDEAPLGNERHRRPNRAGDDATAPGSDRRTGVDAPLFGVSTREKGSRCPATTQSGGDESTRELDRRSRSGAVLRPHPAPGDPHGAATAGQGHDRIAGFEVADDARRWMRARPNRLAQFGLRLNEAKTQVLAFGKRQAWPAVKGQERLPTWDFLGYTHDWGSRRTGKVRLKRKPSKPPFRRVWVAINQGLRRERNARQRPERWQARGQKVRGHFNDFGVTDNSRAVSRFEPAGHALLRKWLNRRSQRHS